ncbi:MAG: hydrogenase maturation protease [candidate division WOR-3 bacterium]|nr:MAG: hydrogenase maturation protease [candidate division WOR-3 bacterium]
MSSEKILIYGIGNPYRCDDGVGIRAAEEISRQIADPGITVKWGSIDGVAILDEITGYDHVIFIDSVKTENGKPGDIYRIKPSTDQTTEPFSSHGINFITALQFGKKFGLKMPSSIQIFAVEIEDNSTFSEECTPEVKKSIPEVARAVLKEIGS